MPTPITIVGGQLDDPPEFALPIITAVGRAAFAWGRIEQHVDMILISINKEYFSSRPYRPTPSTSFRMKIDLFRNWFVRDPRFAEFSDDARRLAKSLRAASSDRQLLFHSNLQRFEEGPPAKMIVARIWIKGENVAQQRGEWTESQILGFADGLTKLNLGLRMISVRALTKEFLASL